MPGTTLTRCAILTIVAVLFAGILLFLAWSTSPWVQSVFSQEEAGECRVVFTQIHNNIDVDQTVEYHWSSENADPNELRIVAPDGTVATLESHTQTTASILGVAQGVSELTVSVYCTNEKQEGQWIASSAPVVVGGADGSGLDSWPPEEGPAGDQAAADLQVMNATVIPNTAISGESVRIGAEVHNEGTASSAATKLRFYRSTNAIISGLDTEIGVNDIPVISASRHWASVHSFTAPTDAGTYYYGACVDTFTGESITYNNCSLAATLTVTQFGFTPDPMVLGGVSNVWTVPDSVSRLYLDVDYAVGENKDPSGDILIQRVNSSNTVLETYAVDNENDSGALSSNFTAGARIRIEIENDAFDTHASAVTLTFHSGTSVSAPEVAVGNVQKEQRPFAPRNGSATVDSSGNGTVTLTWSKGIDRPHDNPDHYRLEIPDTHNPGTFLYTDHNISDSNDPTTYTISNARSHDLEGTHIVHVTHCNSVGGCSFVHGISFTLNPPPPPPTAIPTPTPSPTPLPPKAPPPPNIRLTRDTSSLLTIGWDDRTGASGYQARHRGDGSSWETSNKLPITTKAYSAIGVSTGKSYEFQVRSEGDGSSYRSGWGDWSTSHHYSAPYVELSDLVSSLRVGDVDEFSVNVSDLNEERDYALAAHADRESGLGAQEESEGEPPAVFGQADCSVKVLRRDLDSNTQHYTWDLEVIGCAEGNARITGMIRDRTGISDADDYREVARVTANIRVEPMATPTPTPTPTPLPKAPAPSNIRLVRDTSNLLTIAWDSVGDVSRYQMQYSEDESSWDENDPVSSETTTDSATGLDSGKTYAFQVRSEGDGSKYLSEWGDWSTTHKFNAPQIRISDLTSLFEVGDVDEFDVVVSKLNQQRDYALSAHARDRTGLGVQGEADDPPAVFGQSDCAVTVLRQDLDASTLAYTWDLIVRGCIAGDGRIWGLLWDRTGVSDTSNYREVARVSQDIEVVTPTPTPTPIPMNPPAPTNLKVKEFDQNSVTLSWDARTGVIKYQISYGENLSVETSNNSHKVIGLDCGTEYTFTVAGYGDGTTYMAVWGGEATINGSTAACPPVISIAPETPGPTNAITEGAPARFTLTANRTLSADLVVNVGVSETGTYLTGTIPTTITIAANQSTATLILDTEDDRVKEADGSITGTVKPGTGYTVKSMASSASIVVRDNEVQLGKPEPWVIPDAPRHVSLVWLAIDEQDDDTEFSVDVRAPGGNWSALVTKPTIKADGGGVLRLNLDELIDRSGTIVGLTSEDHYDYQFTATDKNNNKIGNVSDVIRITSNPLLSGGKAYSPGSGQAYLEWDRDTSANNYAIRYRHLLGEGSGDRHSDDDWAKGSTWPYYSSETFPEITDASMDGKETLTGLNDGEIYAFRVNYDLPGTTSDPRAVHVFSARDAYVWVSGGSPSGRVASFPSFGHHAGKTFEYVLCGSTFNDPATPLVDESAKWVPLIKDAFELWATALDDFITVRESTTKRCLPTPMASPGDADYPTQLQTFMVSDDQQNDIRMFDVFDWSDPKQYVGFPEVRADVLKDCLVPKSLSERIPACVTSFHGYTGLGDNLELRQRYNMIIDDYVAGNITYTEARISIAASIQLNIALEDLPNAGDPIRGVDVSFRRQLFHYPDPENGDAPAGPNRPTPATGRSEVTRFNACLSRGDPDHNDNGATDPYYAYATTVHEAGHALGLSALSKYFAFNELIGTADTYKDSHPTIPESVLNYDGSVREYAGWLPSGHSEPDCFPHPFDIMAMYALYQSK